MPVDMTSHAEKRLIPADEHAAARWHERIAATVEQRCKLLGRLKADLHPIINSVQIQEVPYPPTDSSAYDGNAGRLVILGGPQPDPSLGSTRHRRFPRATCPRTMTTTPTT